MASTCGRIVVSSLVRYAGAAEPSGFLSVVDLGTRRVIARRPVPESVHRRHDPNPRGGVRGAKGVSVWGDRLVVANSERVFVVGSDWSLGVEITHPWLGGIHDILAEAGAIWVTCASSDLLVRISWEGDVLGTWSWRADRGLAHALGFRDVPQFDASLDYRDPRVTHTGVYNLVHLNGVAPSPDGLLLSFGRVTPARELTRRVRRARAARAVDRIGLGRTAVTAVARARGSWLHFRREPVDRMDDAMSARILVSRDGGPARIVHRADGAAVPTHNVHAADGLVLYNDSGSGALVAVDPVSGRRMFTIPIPGTPPFPRGLAALNGRLLIGSQRPAAVHAVDLEHRRVVDSIPLGRLPSETVYAVCGLPDSFDDPTRGWWSR